mmetsp:Transcript_36026/g.115726  ORF Transcript_36026/g.115726 Transcript_36026/m.115726 type:complete len:221 (-) Transcript_36026:779-1441(-)
MASASVSKTKIGATGPKISCVANSIVASQPSRTVGAKKLPGRPPLLPPTTTVAPFVTASATRASTLVTAAGLMRGPVVVEGSVPMPSLSLLTAVANLATKAWCTCLCTKSRLVHTHVCPALRNLAATAPSTALSRSQSSNTMKGALPPSSSESRFTVPEHCRISSFPTAVEPVKDSFRTSDEAHIASPTAGALPTEAVTTDRTPGGTPARCASSQRASAE